MRHGADLADVEQCVLHCLPLHAEIELLHVRSNEIAAVGINAIHRYRTGSGGGSDRQEERWSTVGEIGRVVECDRKLARRGDMDVRIRGRNQMACEIRQVQANEVVGRIEYLTVETAGVDAVVVDAVATADHDRVVVGIRTERETDARSEVLVRRVYEPILDLGNARDIAVPRLHESRSHGYATVGQ